MGRAAQIAAAVVGAIVLVLVVAQVVLPKVAAATIRSRLGRYGRVQSVSVSAWPAVKLLWQHADTVTVHMLSISASPHQAASSLWEGRGAHSIKLTAARAKIGPLGLQDVTFTKSGAALSARGQTTAAEVAAALPGVSISLLRSEAGHVAVRAGGGLFGLSASIEVEAGPQEGRLVAHPVGFLLGGFQLTLFSDPHIRIDGVGAGALAGERSRSYQLQMSATLV